jgi:ELWxxDGT repeat protein
MTTWFPHRFWKKRSRDRSRRFRNGKPSGRSVLRAEALEDRLLPSLAPKLLLDINPAFGSFPLFFTQVNNLVFFSAADGVHGYELWETNGSAAGTFLVKDINPRATSSYPFALTNVKGTLFFSADDVTHGRELWESDGTALGTFLVKDINPGTNGSNPTYLNLTNVNGTLFFSADDGTHGFELWRSNGTAAGTFLVKDINPGKASSYPFYLVNANGTLFFRANDGANGAELWASNGTAAGTFLVKDINPGGTGSYPAFLANVSGTVFFWANDGTHGVELWASNGSSAGTFLVKDINPGAGSSIPPTPTPVTNVNGTLFFAADDGTHGFELWESNGTAAGTLLVKDINPVAGNSYPGSLVNVNGTLFFSANDGTNGAQLWESNGSSAGTFRLGTSSPGYLVNVNGILFFSASDSTHGTELWESNGSSAGTSLVADINPGALGSNPRNLTSFDGDLLFSADGDVLWIFIANPSTTTTVSSSPNPSVFSQAVTVTAVVGAALGASPTGTVDFKDGAADLTPGGVTLAGNQATFTTAALAVGSHTITAIYSGDSNFTGSHGDDSASPHVVDKDSSHTTVFASPSTLVSGQAVALVAIVSNSSGPFATPTGAVQFAIDGTNLGAPVTLNNGVASLPAKLSATGSPHTITATYTNSDGNFVSGSGSATQAVSKDGTGLTLVSSTNPSVFGQTISLTALVNALAPGSGTPTGTVDFKEGATDLTPGGITLTGGQAIFRTSSLSLGKHTITATYGATTNFTGSQADDSAAPQVVNQALSRTVLTSFPDPSLFGEVVPFTVLVSALSPGRGTPTGTVIFTDGTTTIGSITLTGGRATFTTASLTRGNHAISASYTGDTNFTASAYTGYGQTVQKAATTATLAPGANPVVVNQTLTLTATVQASSPGAGAATGTVTFMDFSSVLGTGTLNASGKASFTTSGLAVGMHALTAAYAGDNNFTPSVSALLTETVKASATVVIPSAPPPNRNGRPPALTSSQSSPVRVLSAQRIDAFFDTSTHRRRVPSLRAARPRAARNGAIPLEQVQPFGAEP